MGDSRMPILASAAVTALATGTLFFLPAVAPVSAYQEVVYELTGSLLFRNPFRELRLFGGIPGGFAGGYLARDHFGNPTRAAAMKVGIYGVMGGILVVWGLFVLYNVANAALVYGVFPPLYDILVLPMLLALPLVPTYLIEGIVFGVLGNAVSLRGSSPQTARDPD